MSNHSGSITYGKENIAYDVLYLNRKTMEIAVHPCARVVVKVPEGTGPSIIQERLIKRGRWIRKQLDYFRQFEPRTPARRYVSGETHLYLGRRYRLKLQAGESNEVKLTRGYLLITCNSSSAPDQVKDLLDRWYMQKAKQVFGESLQQCTRGFKQMELPQPVLHLRRMKTRWGSLSQKQALTLNIDLIRAPKECIDYIVIHELCHLKYPKHDPDFYELLEKVMPGWEKRKHKLELTLV